MESKAWVIWGTKCNMMGQKKVGRRNLSLESVLGIGNRRSWKMKSALLFYKL